MQLNKADKKLIIKGMIHRFDMELAKAKILVDNMQKALLGENKDFFYQLKYDIHFQNDPKYSMKVIKCAIDSLYYLVNKEEYASQKEELKAFYYLFFETIFVQRCSYAQKSEKRADTVRRVLQHMGKQSQKTLDTQQLMIANTSHEMRTSLNAIQGYLSLIDEKNTLTGEDKSFLDKANSATSTLRALMSDILDITKINSGQMEIKKEFFWLDEMILKCIDSIAVELSKKDIHFETEIDFFPTEVFGDREHMMGIVVNILSNAVKYTDNGFVKFIVKRDQKLDNEVQVLFQVVDSGIGMTQEQIKDIFDPYSRFKIEKQGLGLGLHIAQKLSQKLQATLTAKSEFGKGSIFDFNIQLKEKSDNGIRMDKKTVCFFNNSRKRDSFEQKLDFLKKYGVAITIFENEEEFIHYLLISKENIPDMISVITNHEGYSKFDSLINYLKTLSIYSKTIFVAENTGDYISLAHFDMIYNCFTPISTYIDILSIPNDEKDTIDKVVDLDILAIDDIGTNLEILKMFILKRYPQATIDLATGGYEGVGMYKTRTYNIIFIDLKMPGLNGFDVLEKFKEIKNLPPTYALTADVYKSTFDRVMQSGFTGLLEKPLQLDLLFETIEKAIHETNH